MLIIFVVVACITEFRIYLLFSGGKEERFQPQRNLSFHFDPKSSTWVINITSGSWRQYFEYMEWWKLPDLPHRREKTFFHPSDFVRICYQGLGNFTQLPIGRPNLIWSLVKIHQAFFFSGWSPFKLSTEIKLVWHQNKFMAYFLTPLQIFKITSIWISSVLWLHYWGYFHFFSTSGLFHWSYISHSPVYPTSGPMLYPDIPCRAKTYMNPVTVRNGGFFHPHDTSPFCPPSPTYPGPTPTYKASFTHHLPHSYVCYSSLKVLLPLIGIESA